MNINEWFVLQFSMLLNEMYIIPHCGSTNKPVESFIHYYSGFTLGFMLVS